MPPDAILENSRGNLHKIDDVRVRGELKKLWEHVEQRTGQNGNTANRFVTLAELNSLKRQLNDFKVTPASTGFTPAVVGGGSGTSGGASNDLLLSDNQWRGKQTWARPGEAGYVPTYRFLSLNAGELVIPGGVIRANDYSAAFDLQKTSASSVLAGGAGGNFAAYMQHRVDNTSCLALNLSGALRAHMETEQNSVGGNYTVCAFFVLNNKGVLCNGTAVNIELHHRSVGATVNSGVTAHLYRRTTDGYVAGFIADTGDGIDCDAGFLAAPGFSGSNIKFRSAFAAGSALGALTCDIGLDLSLSTCTLAGVAMKAGQKLQLNAPNYDAGSVGMFFDPAGITQFYSDLGKTFAIGNDGSVILNRPEGEFRAVKGAGGAVIQPTPGAPLVAPFFYLVVHFGGPGAGTKGYIPVYQPA